MPEQGRDVGVAGAERAVGSGGIARVAGGEDMGTESFGNQFLDILNHANCTA